MWLIDPSFYQQFEGVTISAADIRDFEARMGDDFATDPSRIMSVEGNLARINVEGVLTARPNIFAMLFGGGGTTYPQFINALAAAEQDGRVEAVDVYFNTPGGTVDGLFPAVEAYRNMRKPTTSVITGQAASAGYGLASQGKRVVAESRASRAGSVGVVVDFRIDKNSGSVTSTNAPNKRPDLSTDEGKAQLRSELDDLEAIFIDEIAAGRGVSGDKVRADFGRGGMFTAEKALKAGMIDAIRGKTAETETPAIPSGNNPEGEKAMDLDKLKAEHRDVYEAAVAIGEAKERERVEAHLQLGEAYGAMDTALAAVKDGSELTIKLQSAYLAAGANRSAVNDRQDENANVDADNEENVPDASTAKKEGSIKAMFAHARDCGLVGGDL